MTPLIQYQTKAKKAFNANDPALFRGRGRGGWGEEGVRGGGGGGGGALGRGSQNTDPSGYMAQTKKALLLFAFFFCL